MQIEKVDVEQRIFTALSAPLVCDALGNIFALRPDGATVSTLRAGSDAACFFRPSTERRHTYVATPDDVYVLINGNTRVRIPLSTTRLFPFRVLPNLSPFFSLDSASDIDPAILAVSSEATNKCLLLGNAGVASLDIPQHISYLCGWFDEETICLAGMKRRSQDSHRTGYTRSASGFTRIQRRTRDVKWIVTTQPRLHRESSCLDDLGRSLVNECWLACVYEGEHRFLAAGLYNSDLLEDSWLLGSTPNEADFPVVGLYIWENSGPELLHIWHPFRFRQLVATPTGILLYMTRWEHGVSQSLDSLVVFLIGDNASSIRSVHIAGLRTDLPVSFLEVHFDRRVGLYGCISVRQALYEHLSYLVKSDDGVHWTMLHELVPRSAPFP